MGSLKFRLEMNLRLKKITYNKGAWLTPLTDHLASLVSFVSLLLLSIWGGRWDLVAPCLVFQHYSHISFFATQYQSCVDFCCIPKNVSSCKQQILPASAKDVGYKKTPPQIKLLNNPSAPGSMNAGCSRAGSLNFNGNEGGQRRINTVRAR